MRILFLVGVLAWGAASCNTSGCLDNSSSIPLAGFYDASTGNAISLDSLEIGGEDAPGDSLLTSSMGAISQIYLPFRSAYNTVTFYIRYCQYDLGGLEDYITFDYTSEPFLASEECGAMYQYRITRCEYTTTVIDSVVVTDSLITNVDLERIRIYFRTATDDDETVE